MPPKKVNKRRSNDGDLAQILLPHQQIISVMANAKAEASLEFLKGHGAPLKKLKAMGAVGQYLAINTDSLSTVKRHLCRALY